MAEKSQAAESRFIALDVGQKRIGVAVSDISGRVALPLQVIIHSSFKTDAKTIAELVAQYQVEVIVVGYPLTLNGEPGPQSRIVEAFISKALAALPVKIERWDERLTTVTAEKDLIRAGVKRKKRRGLIDAAAATIILQSFLDSKN